MKRPYLLDTNHVGAALTPVSPVRDRLRQARRQGVVMGTCVPVLCEMEAGIQQAVKPKWYRRTLRELLTWVRIWPLEPKIAPLYGVIFQDLKRRGRILSPVDILLAALAQQRNLVLLTSDKDFEALPDVRTENWLT